VSEYAWPYGPMKRPKVKRPKALLNTDVADVSNVALVINLLLANVELDEPQSLVWWAERCNPSDIAAAFRAVVEANPKLLSIEDKSKAEPTRALYLIRCDYTQLATLYLDGMP
jgi:hypothetical protein